MRSGMVITMPCLIMPFDAIRGLYEVSSAMLAHRTGGKPLDRPVDCIAFAHIPLPDGLRITAIGWLVDSGIA